MPAPALSCNSPLLTQPVACEATPPRCHPRVICCSWDRQDTPEESEPPPCPRKARIHHNSGSAATAPSAPRGDALWHRRLGSAVPQTPLSPPTCHACLPRQAWRGGGHLATARVPYKERNPGTGYTLPPAPLPGIALENSRQPVALQNSHGSALAWGWLPAWRAALCNGCSMTPVLFGDPEVAVKALITPVGSGHRELTFLSSDLVTGKQPPRSCRPDFQGPAWPGWCL